MRLGMALLAALTFSLHVRETAAEDLLPVPFHSDITQAGAFVGMETMEVFLVWESDVVVISFELPESETGILALDVSNTGPCLITQFHGENISQYALPTGPAVPIPPGYQYWSRDASGGTVIFGNVPVTEDPEFGSVVTVVLDGIDFGDGETHSFGPVETVTGAYPP